jgi:hypothetical protein
MDTRTVSLALIAAFLGAALLGGGIWIGQSIARSTTAASWLYGDMMGATGGGMMGGGMMGGGWIGASGMMSSPGTSGAEPLSTEDATQAVEKYLQAIGLTDLEIGEVMIFDNHAYAQVVDEAKNGAFEVLVDPVTRSVGLEYGPAMMWNIEYGMMGGRGAMMGSGLMGSSMMGGAGSMMAQEFIGSSDEAISADQAIEIAQDYLDRYLPALAADEHADAFPGYFTIHTLQEGETVGMLSVNAFNGDVWYHTWHGTLIEGDSHDE